MPVWCLCEEEQARVPGSWCSNPGRDAQMAHKGKDSTRRISSVSVTTEEVRELFFMYCTRH